MCLYFEGNQEAPAEAALGEAGEESSSAGSCQLSAEMKGERPAGCAAMTPALFYPILDSEVVQLTYECLHGVIQLYHPSATCARMSVVIS